MTDIKKKTQLAQTRKNVLEALKDFGGSIPADAFNELVGFQKPEVKKSGDISIGESLQISEILNGKEEENKKIRIQTFLERNMAQDEARLSEKKLNELRVQLQALVAQIANLAQSTDNLAKEAKQASFVAPVNPGIYHTNFLENIIEFLISFRKGIDQASVWLSSANSRAEKKNYWARYKKGRGSFLLSPDHYLQRSAG